MEVTRKRRRKVEIPTASTGDIAFLLIVFFMATTKFDVKEGVKVQLTKAVDQAQQKASEIKLTDKEMTRIDIMENGQLSINGAEPITMSDADLDKRILEKIEMRDGLNKMEKDPVLRSTKMLFLVKTDPEANYEHMVRVVERLVTYRDRALISISTSI
ncbi:MAG: biopolymer transporter ExbD [Candidatus Cloacimonetes bacterium]|jgi:biopolymer transport protein ExbD|nr:biopolymer transporter ExbD [Candidatus Cloacimonadota bacterium]MDX9948845.1 biopolymer transporter ExbD [Candidatus Syntrophosphaera sp.]NLN84896.1 biopolymer transporter ExbD [Candidatus Cloacimonadota bacterium]